MTNTDAIIWGAIISTSGLIITSIVLYTKGTTWLAAQLAVLNATIEAHGEQLGDLKNDIRRIEQRSNRTVNTLNYIAGKMALDPHGSDPDIRGAS